LKGTLEKELDFINEANNSKRCDNELKHLKFVYVPKVYDNYTTEVCSIQLKNLKRRVTRFC